MNWRVFWTTFLVSFCMFGIFLIYVLIALFSTMVVMNKFGEGWGFLTFFLELSLFVSIVLSIAASRS